MMDTTLFTRYADLAAQIKNLEQEQALLKPTLLADLEELEAKTLSTKSGTFSVASKKTWTYSLPTQKKELDLKLTKKREEEEALATCTASTFLRFQLTKQEETTYEQI